MCVCVCETAGSSLSLLPSINHISASLHPRVHQSYDSIPLGAALMELLCSWPAPRVSPLHHLPRTPAPSLISWPALYIKHTPEGHHVASCEARPVIWLGKQGVKLCFFLYIHEAMQSVFIFTAAHQTPGFKVQIEERR